MVKVRGPELLVLVLSLLISLALGEIGLRLFFPRDFCEAEDGSGFLYRYDRELV